MLNLFYIFLISAVFSRGGRGGSHGGPRGGGRGGGRCTSELSADEQLAYLSTALASIASSESTESITCEMSVESAWPHLSETGATRRLLRSGGRGGNNVQFDVNPGTEIGSLLFEDTCLTQVTLAVKNVEYVETSDESDSSESSRESDSDSSDCDDSEEEEAAADEEEAEETTDEEVVAEETTDEGVVAEETTDEEVVAEEADTELPPLRRALSDEDRVYAVVTLTQTNTEGDNVTTMDLTVKCSVDFNRDCESRGLRCRHGAYTYSVDGEDSVAEFRMDCQTLETGATCA